MRQGLNPDQLLHQRQNPAWGGVRNNEAANVRDPGPERRPWIPMEGAARGIAGRYKRVNPGIKELKALGPNGEHVPALVAPENVGRERKSGS